MKKSKKISVFIIISIILSSMPFSVSALQYGLEDTEERIELSVEEETTEEINEETSAEEATDIFTEEERPQTNINEHFDMISDTTYITIPHDKCLVLGEEGKYKIIEGNFEGIPEDLDWTEVDGEYTSNSSITFHTTAFLASTGGLENPAVIGSIKAENTTNSSLTILPNSNIEINAGDEPGIQVYSLITGYAIGENPRVKLTINTNSVGIFADYINATNTGFDITSGKMGISATNSHSGSPVKGFLNVGMSDLKVRSTGVDIPAIYMVSVGLHGTTASVVSEYGTGIIAIGVTVGKDSVLVAKSINDTDGKGIVAESISCSGSITGVAEEGNRGIWILQYLSISDPGNGEIPSITGESKTGYGLLIESLPMMWTFSVGILTGKVDDGIGLQCGDIQLGMGYGPTGRSKLIGIAEKGYGISAESIRVNSDNWDVIGEAKHASDQKLFDQEEIPPVAGILLADVLSAAFGGSTVEGAAPPEVPGSCGIFIGPRDSNYFNNGILSIAAYAGKPIFITATGDTAICATRINVTERNYLGVESLVYIMAKGRITGIKVDELTINGHGPEEDLKAYRIKAIGEHGTGLEIMSIAEYPLELYGASIEATGKLHGIYVEGNLDMAELLNVRIVGSQIRAEGEQYGWYSKNGVITILASDDLFENGTSMVEAIGAEVGMKVIVDQGKYHVDGPLIEIKGESVRDSAILKVVAKTAIPDQTTNSALAYDKVIPDLADGINRGVLVDCGTITEEYLTKAEQKIMTIPAWPYAMGLNIDNRMNYEWTVHSNSNEIRVEKTIEGIKTIKGKGDANLIALRKGNEDPTLFADEPIVLLGSGSGNSRAINNAALHQVIVRAYFEAPEGNTGGGGGGGGGATTSTEPENPSTEASTSTEEEGTTSSEIDPGALPSGNTNTEESNVNVSTGTGTKPKSSVTWNNGRPNTGDISSKYTLLAFISLSAISGAYIVILYRKKNRV